MANALLVVDVQQYFLKQAPSTLPQKIARHCQSKSYDLIAFSVFRNHPGSNFVKSLKWDKCTTDEDVVLPAAFDGLAHTDNVFERAAYSSFKTTGLHAYLQQHAVERLIICGIDTDACVLATAFEAFDLGYHVKVEFNLCYSTNSLDEEAEKIIARSLKSRD